MIQALEIRNAVVADASTLAEAEREIAKTPGRFASRPDEIKTEAFAAKIAAMASSQYGYYAVLEEHGLIVGHALLDPHPLAALSHVVSLNLSIHEGHQGKGYGRLLMEHMIAWAKANKKVEKFELQVRSVNTRAIQLYASLGFVEEGRKTKRIKYGEAQYVDDVYMALWVGDSDSVG
jgi:RimJ/RimL family protein N-acetyltransferase